MLHAQLPWFIAGPVLGLCVVVLRALLGERLGLTGAWSSVVESASSSGRRALDFRVWLLAGLVLGGALVALVAGGPTFRGWGWLTDAIASPALVAVVLALAGVLIGFGAKTAAGCTSGNGLSGTAMLSPASLAATATFFATAIGVSFVIEALV
jgi:uncharacterized protein